MDSLHSVSRRIGSPKGKKGPRPAAVFGRSPFHMDFGSQSNKTQSCKTKCDNRLPEAKSGNEKSCYQFDGFMPTIMDHTWTKRNKSSSLSIYARKDEAQK
jgi:hypothetical protein